MKNPPDSCYNHLFEGKHHNGLRKCWNHLWKNPILNSRPHTTHHTLPLAPKRNQPQDEQMEWEPICRCSAGSRLPSQAIHSFLYNDFIFKMSLKRMSRKNIHWSLQLLRRLLLTCSESSLNLSQLIYLC